MNILSVDRTRKTYHIKNSLWFIRLFLNLSHKNSNKFLIIDCRGINKRGPDKFRTKTDSPEEQWCHLNINSNSKQCNTHLSKRFLNRESETDKPLFNNRKSYWKDKEWWTFTWTKYESVFVGKEIPESTQQTNCSLHVGKMLPSKR